ncbi:MAG TPA: lanthionine synthetase C family protein [Ktedonobacteraceae bacterium]|jgi:lantibiotic modifying enzyme|nr:lanthionine synthetase C family protein [Ktedonobacteraceae bacterium]
MHESARSNDSLSIVGKIPTSLVISWNNRSLIEESLRNRALEAVQVVAARLRDPQRVVDIARIAEKQSTLFLQWNDASLACGFSSTALLYLFLAQSNPEQGWETIAQQHLRLAAEGTHRQPFFSPALFGGSSGLASLVSLFYHHESRYQKTYQTLNTRLAQQVINARWRREDFQGVAFADYDVISGAAGILGYLVTIDQPDETVHDAIQILLEYLIWMAGSDPTEEHRRWFIHPELHAIPSHRDTYPEGYFDCGLAHGIAGPLAALAAASLAGYYLPGQREAMLSLSQWILDHRLQDRWGINWPAGIPRAASFSAEQYSQLHPSRAGWCYGSPGMARALWLAGVVLNEATIQNVAVEAVESFLRRPKAALNIDSVSFCHGVSGLLSICLRFAHETESPLILQHIPLLVQQILDDFNPDLPLGFRDLELANNAVDDPGLLTGAVGIALSLLSVSTSIEPAWHRLFLIT